MEKEIGLIMKGFWTGFDITLQRIGWFLVVLACGKFLIGS